MTKKSVVAQSAPQKHYHHSTVHDSKRCGFEGLLSRPAVHAARRDGEDRSSNAVLGNLWREEGEVLVRLFERSDLPFIGAREGGERAATEGETKRRRRSEQPAAEGLHRSHSNSTIAKTFQLPCDLSYTRSAWQKFRHRLGSFPQPAARRDEAWHGVAWRGGRRRRSARGCPSCCHAHTSGERASLIKRSNSL